MKKVNDSSVDELRPEYDLSKLKRGPRGKYAEQYKKGTNLVLIAPDIAEVFPDEAAVNEALRTLMRIARTQVHHVREKS